MKIKNNLTPSCICDLYDNADNFFFTILDEGHFADVRLQIKEKKLSGFYVIWEGQKILINDDGKCEFPQGFYDYTINLSFKLL